MELLTCVVSGSHSVWKVEVCKRVVLNLAIKKCAQWHGVSITLNNIRGDQKNTLFSINLLHAELFHQFRNYTSYNRFILIYK